MGLVTFLAVRLVPAKGKPYVVILIVKNFLIPVCYFIVFIRSLESNRLLNLQRSSAIRRLEKQRKCWFY